MKTSSAEAFTFDDVLILPAPHSRVKSRKEVSTAMQYGPFKLELPIFTASMAVFDTDYAGTGAPNSTFARAVAAAGGVHIQSRGMPQTSFHSRFAMVSKLAAEGLPIGIAVGLDEFLKHNQC